MKIKIKNKKYLTSTKARIDEKFVGIEVMYCIKAQRDLQKISAHQWQDQYQGCKSFENYI